MKLIYTLWLIFLFLFVGSGTAQVRIGFLGGINSTGFSGDYPPDDNYSSDFGYNLGAKADIYLTDDIAVNLQPAFSYRATIIQYDVNYQYDKYDSLSIQTDYFEIPINVKIVADNQFTYVTAGLSVVFPVNSQVKNNRTGNRQDVSDQFESYVLNANFGVGIQFEIGKPMMFVEISYSQSLTNLAKLNAGETAIIDKLKSNSLQLYTGILFTL